MTQQLDPKLIVESVPRVDNSMSSPCWQQEQIAAQNSWLATAKTGKEVVYIAPCKAKKPPTQPAPVAASEQKLS